MALFAQRTRELALLQKASPCQKATGKFVYEAISVGLSFAQIHIKTYLGDKTPNLLEKLDEVYNEIDLELVQEIGKKIQAKDWQGAVGHLWSLMVDLYRSGALVSLIQEALDEMSWWK